MAAAALLFVAIRPVGEVSVVGEADVEGTFSARGANESAATFRVRCAGTGAVGTCPVGDRILFELVPGPSPAYFAAFARRPDGAILWYFPAATDKSMEVSSHSDQGLLDVSVILDDQHLPGMYQVHGVFSARPLTRDEIRAIVTKEANDAAEVILVERTLEVVR